MKYSIHCSILNHYSCRLDVLIIDLLPFLPFNISRVQLVKIFSKIVINNKKSKRSVIVSNGDEVYVELESASRNFLVSGSENKNSIIQNITNTIIKKKLNIIFEDDDIMAINKPRGQVVHPGVGNTTNTIAQMVFSYLKDYRESNFLNNRAGIVHRLDKDTSGIMLIAKTAQIHEALVTLFSHKKIHKQYLAIIKKTPQHRVNTLTTYIGRDSHHRKRFSVQKNKKTGKIASTSYRVLFSNSEYSVVLCEPHTGRTHQIRVHMQHIGTPILGDRIYSRKSKDKFSDCALMLHAYKLEFDLEIKNNYIPYSFCAPIPQDMLQSFEEIGFTQDITMLL